MAKAEPKKNTSRAELPPEWLAGQKFMAELENPVQGWKRTIQKQNWEAANGDNKTEESENAVFYEGNRNSHSLSVLAGKQSKISVFTQEVLKKRNSDPHAGREAKNNDLHAAWGSKFRSLQHP